MPTISVKVEGLEELRRRFREAPRVVMPELSKATKEAGKELLGASKKEAPIKTGQLRRSISMDYRPIQVAIYPSVTYAYWVHEGSRPHEIRASRARALRFKSRSGQIVYVKKVKHPGHKGNPFMERAVSKTEAKINSIFRECLNNIVKKL